MHCSNKISDYSVADFQQLMAKAEEFKKIFEDADKILREKKAILDARGKKPQVTIVEGQQVENCVWVDPSITVKFEKMKEQKLPLHLCVEVYEEWFDQLYKLTIVNDHALTRKSVFTHVVGILMVCATFGNVLAEAVPPNPLTNA